MSLEDILKYLHDREVWTLNLLIRCDGFEKVCEILSDNGRI